MRKAGVAHSKSSKDMESHVFLKAKTRVRHCWPESPAEQFQEDCVAGTEPFLLDPGKGSACLLLSDIAVFPTALWNLPCVHGKVKTPRLALWLQALPLTLPSLLTMSYECSWTCDSHRELLGSH